MSRLSAVILLVLTATAASLLPHQRRSAAYAHQLQNMAAEPVRNPLAKTLGGMQFWTDVRLFHGWRIQRNALTGRYRLLDEKNYRHASGTLAECEQRLREFRRKYDMPEMTGRVVILIHGIGRSSRCFLPLQRRLEEDGFTALRFDYASTRIAVEEAAEALSEVLASLEAVEEIDLVAHSMGGLVLRKCLADHPDDRVKRVVMMGTPNKGAEMADLLQTNVLYRGLWGRAGQQLVSDPDAFIASLPAPPGEFAVIAGARGNGGGWNPLIPGDDDGLVSVESARLEGMADFQTVRSMHMWLMRDEEAMEMVVRFLRTGSLRASH